MPIVVNSSYSSWKSESLNNLRASYENYRPCLKLIIIHSKYIPVSYWLKFSGYFFITSSANVHQIQRTFAILKTLRSDNGDVHENVVEKMDFTSFQTFSRLSQFALLLKRRKFWLELKRGGRARVQTEMVEFIPLSFPYSSKLKVWSFHVVVVQAQQRNVQKSVMHVQSCCFAH